MPLLNILQFPDPRLKKVAEPVDTFDHEILQLVQNMLETMYGTQGVGLAATQVNVQKQILVGDVSEKNNQPFCMINPKILEKRGEVERDEGCLSFPGVYVKVKRAKEVDVEFRDHEGRLQQVSADGLFAICIQHEIDHLLGITFFDYLSPLKQTMMRKKLDKFRRKTQ